MNILVTGSSGYIGRELTNYLSLFRDYKVFGLDVVDSGNESLKGFEKANVLDISKQPFEKIDYIIHLAGASKVDLCYDWNHYYSNNTESTIRLKAIYPNARLLLASTTGVYNEEGVVDIETSDYIKSKYFAERYADLSMRFGTVCGTNIEGASHTVVDLMIHSAIKRRKVICAQGDKFRPLVGIDSLCRKIRNSLDMKGLINFYDCVVTIEEIAWSVAEVMPVIHPDLYGLIDWREHTIIELIYQDHLEGISKKAPRLSSIPPETFEKDDSNRLDNLRIITLNCLNRYHIYKGNPC